MKEQQAKDIVQSLTGISFREWQVIERVVNDEFKRMSNQNYLNNAEKITKNCSLELNLQ